MDVLSYIKIKLLGQGYNRREQKQNALLHAEIEAINEAVSNAALLASGGLPVVCDARTLSDVCGRNIKRQNSICLLRGARH